MKHLGIWLLLPWVVYVSSVDHQEGLSIIHYYAKHDMPGHEPSAVQCGEDSDSCQDFVDAMNTAHERRGYAVKAGKLMESDTLTPAPEPKKKPKAKLKLKKQEAK